MIDHIIIGVLIGIPIGAVLLVVGVAALVLWDTRNDIAEPDPPRMGEPMMWRG